MKKSKKVKIIVGLFYSILILSFLFFFFSKFSFSELTSYEFIQKNREYLYNLKSSNLFFLSTIFLVLIILWTLMLGFGSPVAFLCGFVFGKFLGTFLTVMGCATGATLLYLFANYFFKDLVKEKFLSRFGKLEKKFKKNELTFFIIFRFVGGIPFAVANILPVLFNVSIKNYFLGTFLGILPQLFILASIGSGLEGVIEKNESAPSIVQLLQSQEIYLPIIGFFGLLVFILLIKKYVIKF